MAIGRKSSDFSPLHYLNSDLKNLYTSLFGVPNVNNMVCLINKDLDLVQMGEVIWNSHEYIDDPQAQYNKITVVREREAAKCRRSIQDIAGKLIGGSDANKLNKLFTAVYEDKLTAYDHIEQILDYRLPSPLQPGITVDSEGDHPSHSTCDDETDCDWTNSQATLMDENQRRENDQKELLREYPKQALECYKLVDIYRDFRADVKVRL